MKNFYLTTAIDYANGSPHLGHAYEKVLADVIARYKRMCGRNVYFLTGLDEHGQKVQQSAKKAGISPQEMCDKQAEKFIAMCRMLNISNDDYIRTTQPRHKETVAKILQALFDRGEIYKAEYKGFYSARQEQFLQEKDKVFVDKKMVRPVKHEYYKFFKPAGYITTADDEKGRKTIYDLLPENLYHLKPVGRLDKDSTGLIILTNDGELINQLTHPSVKVPKVYLVSVNGRVHKHELEQMALGIELEKGKMAYADITVLEMDNNVTTMKITLFQGLNRQIRKMFEHFGYEVKSLKRIQHATVSIEGLKRGEFKPIKPQAVKELKNFLNRK